MKTETHEPLQPRLINHKGSQKTVLVILIAFGLFAVVMGVLTIILKIKH